MELIILVVAEPPRNFNLSKVGILGRNRYPDDRVG